MTIGFCFFGIGSEAMCIIITSFAACWFMGKELSLGLGITMASANMGMVMANWIIPPVYNIEYSINLPFFVGFMILALGYIATFIMTGIDFAAEKDDKLRKEYVV